MLKFVNNLTLAYLSNLFQILRIVNPAVLFIPIPLALPMEVGFNYLNLNGGISPLNPLAFLFVWKPLKPTFWT